MRDVYQPGARTDASGNAMRVGLDRHSLALLWRSALARDIVFAGSVAVVLGLIRIGAPSVWVDEAFTARAVRYPFPDYLLEQYHWLYYAMLKPWTSLAGTSEWVLRLPSVLALMAACGLLVVLAYKLFDRWVALVGGVLLATSPFLVLWSQQARSYTLLVVVSLLATLLLIRALDRGSRAAWLSYGVVFSAVIAVQPVSALVVVPAHAVLVFQRRERLVPHALLAVIAIVALALPWMTVVSVWSQEFWLAPPTAKDAAKAVLNISGAAGLGIPLAVVGLVVLRRAGKTDLAVWLGTWAFAPFLTAAIVSSVKPVFLDRYLIAAAPAFALLGAVAVTGVARRLRVALGVAVVIATSIGLVSWYSHSYGDNWRGENWKRAVATVSERQGSDEPIVVVPWWAHPAASYYGARVVGTSTSDSIWVLFWSEEGHELPLAERRALGFGEHRLVERLQFGWRVSAQRWERGR